MVLKGKLHSVSLSCWWVEERAGQADIEELLGFFFLLLTSVDLQCFPLRDLLVCTEMADAETDQGLNKKLNFSFCEEDTENEGKMTARQDIRGDQSQKPGRDESEELESPMSPARYEFYTSPIRDKESPGPGFPKCPETPVLYSKSKLPVPTNFSTPKVSKTDQVSSSSCSPMGQLMGEEGLLIYIYAMNLPYRLDVSSVPCFLVETKANLRLPGNRMNCLPACFPQPVTIWYLLHIYLS